MAFRPIGNNLYDGDFYDSYAYGYVRRCSGEGYSIELYPDGTGLGFDVSQGNQFFGCGYSSEICDSIDNGYGDGLGTPENVNRRLTYEERYVKLLMS